jgi:hypothetical protein
VGFAQEGAEKAASLMRMRAGIDAGCAILRYYGVLDDSVSVPLK